MPSPSLPTTSATRPSGHGSSKIDRGASPSSPIVVKPASLQAVERTRDVRDPRVREVQQGPRRGADRRGGRRRRTVGARHQHRAPGGLDRPSRGAEVLRVLDTVEHDDDRVRRPLPLRQFPLAERPRRSRGCARPRRGDRRRAGRGPRDRPLGRAPVRTERRRRRRAIAGAPAGATRDQHLVGDTGPHRLDAPRACPPTTSAATAHAITASARQPTPSPASPSPSGRVALTDTRSTPAAGTRRARRASRRGAERSPGGRRAR